MYFFDHITCVKSKTYVYYRMICNYFFIDSYLTNITGVLNEISFGL